jgi:hypothetical protein
MFWTFVLEYWPDLISPLSVIVPLTAALISWRRHDRPLRILGVLFIIAAAVELASISIAYNGKNNHWLLNLWTPVEFSLTILVFACWQKSASVRRVLYWSIPAFIALLVIIKIFVERSGEMDSMSRSISSLLIIGVAAFTFQRLIIEPGDALLRRDPRFWVSSAALIYYAGTLTVVTLGKAFMAEDPKTYNTLYTIHSVINIFTNLLFAGGFLCRKPR